MAKKIHTHGKNLVLKELKESTDLLLKHVRAEFKQNFQDMDEMKQRTFELAATQEKLIIGASIKMDAATSKKAAAIVDVFWKELHSLHLEEVRKCNQLQEIIKACRERLLSAPRSATPKS